MSFEVFEKLEAKVQQAIDTITLLQMEIEELKDKKQLSVAGSSGCLRQPRSAGARKPTAEEEQHVWQDRLRALLGKMEEV